MSNLFIILFRTLFLTVSGILMLPVVDIYLDSIMALHMSAQMGGLVLLGVLTAKTIKKPLNIFPILKAGKTLKLNQYGVSSLIFFLGTITFWMIPRSLDLAVTDNMVDYIMHINLFCAGFLLGKSLEKMPFVLKTAAGIYGLSMWISAGLTYSRYNLLLCATYDLEMQKETGELLLNIFWFAFILFLILTAKNLIKFAQQSGHHDK